MDQGSVGARPCAESCVNPNVRGLYNNATGWDQYPAPRPHSVDEETAEAQTDYTLCPRCPSKCTAARFGVRAICPGPDHTDSNSKDCPKRPIFRALAHGVPPARSASLTPSIRPHLPPTWLSLVHQNSASVAPSRKPVWIRPLLCAPTSSVLALSHNCLLLKDRDGDTGGWAGSGGAEAPGFLLPAQHVASVQRCKLAACRTNAANRQRGF